MWTINPLEIFWDYIRLKNWGELDWKDRVKYIIQYPFVAPVLGLILLWFIFLYYLDNFMDWIRGLKK